MLYNKEKDDNKLILIILSSFGGHSYRSTGDVYYANTLNIASFYLLRVRIYNNNTLYVTNGSYEYATTNGVFYMATIKSSSITFSDVKNDSANGNAYLKYLRF